MHATQQSSLLRVNARVRVRVLICINRGTRKSRRVLVRSLLRPSIKLENIKFQFQFRSNVRRRRALVSLKSALLYK